MVKALRPGQTADDIFTYQLENGVIQTLTITVTGKDDPAEQGNIAPGPVEIAEGGSLVLTPAHFGDWVDPDGDEVALTNFGFPAGLDRVNGVER